MTTNTLTLSEFVLARIAEDEARVPNTKRGNYSTHWPNCGFPGDMPGTCNCDLVPHILATCKAHRAIVELHHAAGPGEWYVGGCNLCGESQPDFPCDTLRVLASVYADHPDFNPEWASVQP